MEHTVEAPEDERTVTDPAPRASRRGWWLAAVALVASAATAGWALAPPPPPASTLPGQIGLYGDALARVPEAPPPTPPARAATPVQVGHPRTINGQVLATLSIPKFGVSVPLLEGIDLWVIDQGSGHWPGSPMPGDKGNMVIGGHRTLYQRPFHNLDQLVPGDQVVLTDQAATRHVYEVRGTIIVPANAVGIVNQNDAHTATLFACHPKGSATHRIVTKLRLLDENGLPVDRDADLPPLDLGARDGDDHVLLTAGLAPPPS